jgi:hypothetical protein
LISVLILLMALSPRVISPRCCGSQSAASANKAQQSPKAKEAQAHYQAGLAALEKNDLAAAEEEMQAAAKLAPKDALIRYKLAVIQAKRDERQASLKNIDVARALGLPKNLDEEALKLAADVIMKQLQANVAKSKKMEAWLDQLHWLDDRRIFSKAVNHDSECAKDYHSIYNVLNLQPDYKEGILSGSLTLQETHRVEGTGASGCPDAPKLESHRDAVLRVVVKPDDGINDGKIRMFAKLESCNGNACDMLGHEFDQGLDHGPDQGTEAYVVDKGPAGPVISISVLSDGDKDGRVDEEFKQLRRDRS